MHSQARRIPWTLSIGLILLALTLALAFLLAQLKSRLMYGQPLPILGQVQEFALTNQVGDAVSMADLRGRIWVADIIFTRCTGPCITMTRRMKELQDAIVPGEARLVSLTTDPEFDTPPVLKKYADRAGSETARWIFLTGPKKEVAVLAIDGLKLPLQEIPPAERKSESDLFIHSTRFVVVDRKGRLRGQFDTGGEGVEWPAEKKKILAAVRRLEREP